MRFIHDWRVWMALLAAAALLLAGAVAFATSGFPGGTDLPALPKVVTPRPLEPTTTVPLPTRVATPPATVTTPPATVTPQPAPPVRPRTTKPAPRSTRPQPDKPRAEEPNREVITPPVREQDESESDRSSTGSGSSYSGANGSVRPLSVERAVPRPRRHSESRRDGRESDSAR